MIERLEQPSDHLVALLRKLDQEHTILTCKMPEGSDVSILNTWGADDVCTLSDPGDGVSSPCLFHFGTHY